MLKRYGAMVFSVLVGLGAVATATPASAQQSQQAPALTQSAMAAPATAFLTAGMVEAAQPSGGNQGVRSQGFGFGVKVGPLFSSFKSANQSYNNKTGLEGGIWFGGNRGGRVGVMGEILYAKKTASQPGLNDVNLYFLEIPILARINVGSASRNGVSVYGLVGSVFDINRKANQKGVNVKKNYESLDMGVLAGVGVEITRFLVEGRFNWGLRNVGKASGLVGNDIKTKSFALLVGLRIN